MSDEESFVILGSSPMSSLENDGMEAKNNCIDSLLLADTPGSRFTSLKNSQMIDLRSAQEYQRTKHNVLPEALMRSQEISKPQITDHVMEREENSKYNKEEEIAGSKLWSTSPQVQVKDDVIHFSLEDCALKSPYEQRQLAKEVVEPKMSNLVDQRSSEESAKSSSTTKSSPPSSAENLAASFIMGEVNSDVLKTSVYSQFPSISMEACAEDVVKLQNMVTEYTQLKSTIRKANNTMKQFYNNSLQWKDKMKTIEEQYKQQLENCTKEIAELRKKNDELESNFKTQIEALEIACKNDREDNIRVISEKNALLENMRAQIIKLEQQQLASFEFVPRNQENGQRNRFNEIQVKDLQTQLSEILAANLDLKDIEKQYIDELNCLRVNLTAAEELIGKNRAEIAELTAININQQQKVQALEESLKSLQVSHEEQKERILLLETQTEVHRMDFKIEMEGREAAVKDKQQLLQDLRALQKRNQELIEEHQKMAENFQKRLLAATKDESNITAASIAAKTYFNNPQRPVRPLPSPSSAATPPVAVHVCPICNKTFKSINILFSHVNDCADKNFK